MSSATVDAKDVTGSRGVSRVLTKLEASVQSGNYYEAHQMYRTLYFRYMAQKRYADCLDLLYKGAINFLNNEQYSSGADLGMLVVDTLEKSNNVEDIELWIQRLSILISLINASVVERETLLVKSVKWSSDVSKNKLGHPLMHKLIAQIMWNEGNMEQARHHFLLSRDGAGCGQMLIQLSQSKGFPTEIDLFIAQVVLQQLCLKEKLSATQTFETYTKYHPKIACCEPPFILPLLNFLYFLLKSVETGRLAIFKTLCDLYKASLARDPSYDKYLQKIGVIFFGAPPAPQRNNAGLFGDLINQLFQSLDDEPNEEGGGPAPSNAVDADLD